ncbi:hypothetical protein ASF55_18125 [Methylobacterium sp. Leaf119]|nr:hypothetical protein Mext_3541 [Methylorubrum extorquens PA1]KQP93863.1 hypothetical protein ASF55_18125 [Methylobacterium sp. Leaf119]
MEEPMSKFDPEEKVTLLQKNSESEVPTATAGISMKEAAHRVAIAPEGSVERMSSVILRDGNEPIQGLDTMLDINKSFEES